MKPSMTRILGRTGLEVSAMGLGCWAIGGVAYRDGRPTGYGSVTDQASLAAIHAALDLGITFFDTADVGTPIKLRDDEVADGTADELEIRND